MILWSIIPPEIVMTAKEDQIMLQEIKYNGITCVVEQMSSREYKVVRVLTTNPNDYLQPELQPGTMLTYMPTCKNSACKSDCR